MNEEDITQQLVAQLPTRPALLHRVRILRNVLEEYYFSGVNDPTLPLTDFVRQHSATHFDKVFYSTIDSRAYNKFNRDNFYQIIQNITNYINSLPELIIYVPFVASDKDLQNIAQWVHNQLSPKYLIALRTDPEVVGGCGLIVNGVYRDYSLGPILQEKREKIAEIVNKYAGM